MIGEGLDRDPNYLSESFLNTIKDKLRQNRSLSMWWMWWRTMPDWYFND